MGRLTGNRRRYQGKKIPRVSSTDDTLLREFETMDELISKALEPECGKLGRSSREKSSGNSWDFGTNFDKAVNLARFGWPEGAQKIKEAAEYITEIIKPQTHQQDIRYTTNGGGFIDIGRYLTGEPECFGTYAPPEDPTKPITLVIDATTHGSTGAQLINNRGAALVAIIDALEHLGYRVECKAVISIEQGFGARTIIITTKVKECEQPVDIDRMAFTFTHPAFLRKIIFGVLETEPEDIRRSFGFSIHSSYGHVAGKCPNPEEVDLFFKPLQHRERRSFDSVKESAKWASRLLVQSGFITQEEDYE